MSEKDLKRELNNFEKDLKDRLGNMEIDVEEVLTEYMKKRDEIRKRGIDF